MTKKDELTVILQETLAFSRGMLHFNSYQMSILHYTLKSEPVIYLKSEVITQSDCCTEPLIVHCTEQIAYCTEPVFEFATCLISDSKDQRICTLKWYGLAHLVVSPKGVDLVIGDYLH